MATEKRLIDANAFRQSLELDRFGYTDIVKVNIALDKSTVDAVEVVRGRWMYYSTTMQECSNCNRHTARHKFKYCPHCGAVMEDHYNDV